MHLPEVRTKHSCPGMTSTCFIICLYNQDKPVRHTCELLTGSDTLMKLNDFSAPNVITSHFKFQLNHARRFRDMNLQKLAEYLRFFFFFFFSSRCESCYKTQTHYPIALKFGTLKVGIRVHPDTVDFMSVEKSRTT